jgi:hypothetical protein
MARRVRIVLSPNASVSFAGLVGPAKGQHRRSPNLYISLRKLPTDVGRCRRLKKECRPPAAVRHRSPRKPAVSRTARLEEKLDSLVSLIKAGSQSNEVISSALTAAIENSTPYDTVLNVPVLTPVSTDDSMGSAYSLAVHTGLRDNSTKPSLVQAEEYLRSFQINNLQYFPFMYIPPTTSAQQLQQEKPFLWLCIMAVSSKSTSQQQALGSEIRHAVAHEVVVQLSRNLEFLLGILIFIAWYVLIEF